MEEKEGKKCVVLVSPRPSRPPSVPPPPRLVSLMSPAPATPIKVPKGAALDPTMASRPLRPPGRRRCAQVLRGLTQNINVRIAGFLGINSHSLSSGSLYVGPDAQQNVGHVAHHSLRRSLPQYRRHASSSAVNDLASSPLRNRDAVNKSEMRRALRVYQKIVSTGGSGEGLGQPLITAAEGCLDVLARLAPRQQEVGGGKETGDPVPADMALQLINHLRSNFSITGQIYEFAIQTLAKQSGRAEDAYDLLNEYISAWESKGRGSPKALNNMRAPNSILISSVINACAKDPTPMGGQMADKLLRQMIQLHETHASHGISCFAPNAVSFTAAIDGWSRRGDAEKAEELLDVMTAYDVEPSIVSYNAVMAAWSRVAEHKKMAAENAEKTFQRILEMPGLEPDVHSYASLLLSLTKSCNQPEGVERAASILLEMEKEVDVCFSKKVPANPILSSVVIPNVVCYNTVIHGYSKLKRPIEAEELVCRMVERHEQNPQEAPAPSIRTFNAAMLAWAQSGHRDAGRNAQNLLETIERMANDDRWGEDRKVATEATVQPDIYGYNIVLDGWRQGSSIESAVSAEKLLQSMERGERFVMPDRTSYNTVIDAFCRAGRNLQQRKRHHNGRRQKENGSNNHMDVTSDEIDAAQRAEDLLYRMDAAGVRPDTWSFNTVLHAWARSGYGKKAAEHASALLLTMEKLHEQNERCGEKERLVHPDARSYSAVIDAIARSGDTNAPDHAAAILSKMEAKGLQPNVYAVNGILNCLAKSSRDNSIAAQEADDILRRMEEDKCGTHRKYPMPDLVSYCIVAVAFAWNRSDAKKAVKAREVLNKMLNYIRGDGFREESRRERYHTKSKLQSAYNSVLSACAHMPRHYSVDDLERAKEVALQTYNELRCSNLVEPNEETYHLLLIICSKLFKRNCTIGDGNVANQKLVKTVMQDCSDRGLVTDRIRKSFEELRSAKPASSKE